MKKDNELQKQRMYHYTAVYAKIVDKNDGSTEDAAKIAAKSLEDFDKQFSTQKNEPYIAKGSLTS